MWMLVALPVMGVIGIVVFAYEVNPLTHRGRLMFLDENTEVMLANEAYENLLKEHGTRFLPLDHPVYQSVARVAMDIVSVIGPELREWDLHVVDDETNVNAFVISSGKIFVFTGIINMCPSSDALAAVLAHEFAHVLSRHMGEKLGVDYLFQLFRDLIHSILYTWSVNLPMLSDISGWTLDVMAPLLTDKPYSRMCETEADLVGLYLMAMAGYNPKAAVQLWTSFAEAEKAAESNDENAVGGGAIFEFASTHPSHERRADNLRQHLDGAMEIYEGRLKLIQAATAEIAQPETVKKAQKSVWKNLGAGGGRWGKEIAPDERRMLRGGHSTYGVRYLTSGVKVYYVPHWLVYDQVSLPTLYCFFPLFRYICIRESIDIVHGHQAFSSMSHEAILNARTMGIPAVFTDHSLLGFEDVSSILMNKLLKFTLSDVNHVICVSHTSKENTVLRAALDPLSVSVIPNAVVPQDFVPNPSARDPNKSKRKELDEGLLVLVLVTIVCVSRLVYRKGTDLLVAVIPIICDLFPEVQFIIGGDGPKRVELEQMREKYVLQDRVTVLGAVRHSEVSNVTEVLPMSAYFVSRLLVVSTEVGGIPEVLPDHMILLAEPDVSGISLRTILFLNLVALVESVKAAIRRIKDNKVDPMKFHNEIKMMYSWYDKVGPFAGKLSIMIVAVSHMLLFILEWLVPSRSIPRAPAFSLNRYHAILKEMGKKIYVTAPGLMPFTEAEAAENPIRFEKARSSASMAVYLAIDLCYPVASQDSIPPLIPPRFLILVSGFVSVAPVHEGYLDRVEGRIPIPSLHVYGEVDSVVTSRSSKELAERFRRGYVLCLQHPGGHYMPQQSEVRSLVTGFISMFDAPPGTPREALPNPVPLIPVIGLTDPHEDDDAVRVDGVPDEDDVIDGVDFDPDDPGDDEEIADEVEDTMME
ncbi:hypothetical protein HDU96_004027 [Phlyctochytrium bullatum]|nr:hypothetical protein HDU96_004027 [Phlyctochytrium bullatum]